MQTRILASLHWLPVCLRIDFKITLESEILLFVFKCLHGVAPKYLTDLLQLSADQLLLAVPKEKRKLRDDRAFSIVAPKLWNELPLHIRQVDSLPVFKSSLKRPFFSLAFNLV